MFSKTLSSGLLAAMAVVGPILFAAPAACQGPDLNAATVYSQNLRQLILNTHNAYRYKHHVAGLVWNNTILSRQMQAAVNTCPDGDPPVANGYSYGENWYAFWVTNQQANFTLKSGDGVRAWGNEEQYYNYTSPGESGGHEVDHFTQLVWNATKSVACAWNTVRCSSPHWQYQLLCGYYPPGNFIWTGSGGDKWRLFRANVFPA